MSSPRKILPHRVLRAVLAGALLPCLALLWASPPAAAQGFGKGYVDPDPFLDLAGEEDLVLEVSIKGALLRLLGTALGASNAEMSKAVAGLEAIQAVIVDLSSAGKRDRGVSLMKNTFRSLDRSGWDRLARVQEEDVNLTVMVRATDETIDGLVVLLHEKSDDQLIFVNISGLIDLAQLEALGRELDIPGLDQVPSER